jgi:hypothetical protein
LQRVHKNQPEHLQFFRGHRKCPIVFTHVYIPKPVPTFGRHALFPSDRTHPDGESCNKQAYRNERQNVVDEIGHVGNSSVFTYVYFLFYFCSKVNTRSSPPFILGFTNSEYTTADVGCVSGERKRMFRQRRTSPFETLPVAAPDDEVLGALPRPSRTPRYLNGNIVLQAYTARSNARQNKWVEHRSC